MSLSPFEYVVLHHAASTQVSEPPPGNFIPNGVYRGLRTQGLLEQRGTGWTITEKGRLVIEDLTESERRAAKARAADRRFRAAVTSAPEGKFRHAEGRKRMSFSQLDDEYFRDYDF